jgi:hypothetical protein
VISETLKDLGKLSIYHLSMSLDRAGSRFSRDPIGNQN